jgi:hypothetical protein
MKRKSENVVFYSYKCILIAIIAPGNTGSEYFRATFPRDVTAAGAFPFPYLAGKRWRVISSLGTSPASSGQVFH